jgi:uncharacterized protein (UPF0262 family)
MAEPGPRHVLGAVILDEVSLAPGSPEQEKERRVAISDLLKSNHFEPAGAPGGPYTLRIGLVEDRLALDISGEGFAARHLLSLAPFRRVVRDYLTICRSYHEAVRDASPAQIETIDMGRRGLHNDGAALLAERLQGKVKTDLATARRLFTLLCALHWRG